MTAPPPAAGDEKQLMSSCLAHTPRYNNDIYTFPRLTKPVNPKGNQPWIFTRRTDAEAPILWPPNVVSWLIGKDPDAGKDWGQEKETTEDEIVGWHHRRNGHVVVQSLSCVWLFVGPWAAAHQASLSFTVFRSLLKIWSLACWSSWGHEESDLI